MWRSIVCNNSIEPLHSLPIHLLLFGGLSIYRLAASQESWMQTKDNKHDSSSFECFTPTHRRHCRWIVPTRWNRGANWCLRMLLVLRYSSNKMWTEWIKSVQQWSRTFLHQYLRSRNVGVEIPCEFNSWQAWGYRTQCLCWQKKRYGSCLFLLCARTNGRLWSN